MLLKQYCTSKNAVCEHQYDKKKITIESVTFLTQHKQVFCLFFTLSKKIVPREATAV